MGPFRVELCLPVYRESGTSTSIYPIIRMSTAIPGQVDNSAYRTTIAIGAPRIKQVAWYCVNIIFLKNPFIIQSSLKVTLLRWFGARLGRGVNVKPAVNIKFPWK